MGGLNRISWPHRSTEIGYWLGARFEGRGAMAAAVRIYTEHAFSGWGLNRVEVLAALDNLRSRRLAERLGFTLEGVRRQAEIVGGRAHDLAAYSMLAADGPGA